MSFATQFLLKTRYTIETGYELSLSIFVLLSRRTIWENFLIIFILFFIFIFI